jgi:hypothetical protein
MVRWIAMMALMTWEMELHTDYDTAREYDLNMLDSCLCHPLWMEYQMKVLRRMHEGEDLSIYGSDNGFYNSFYLKYDPAAHCLSFKWNTDCPIRKEACWNKRERDELRLTCEDNGKVDRRLLR